MGKSKKDNREEANGEIMEENATPASKESGKKAKKGRKNKDVDWEDEVAKELEDLKLEEGGKERSESPEPVIEKKEKKKEKKSKKSKAKDESDEEEVVVQKGGGFAALMMEDDDDLADDSDELVVEKKEKKKKTTAPKKEKPKKKVESDDDEVVVETKKGGGFAALMDDDNDDLDDVEEQVEVKKETKKNKKKEEKPKPPAEDKKKGKKANKKKEEEDLDQILAELEIEYKIEKPKETAQEVKENDSQPTEETSKKKKKKKKKEGSADGEKDVNSTADAASAVIEEEASSTTVTPAVPEIPKSTPAVVADKAPQVESVTPTVSEPMDTNEVKPSEGVKEGSPENVEAKPAEASKSKKKKKKKESAAPEGEDSKEGTPAPEAEGEEIPSALEDEGTGKKKGKKKKEAEEDKDARKGKPSKKALAAMREVLAKQKEEEERLRKEEEERQRQEEERLRQIEEEQRLEQERKERKKQREKERKERLKAEGKLLTPKQKAELKRAQEMLEHRKAQGLVVPEIGSDKRPRPGTRIRPKKTKKEEDASQKESSPPKVDEAEKQEVEVKEEKPDEKEVTPPVEEVKEEEEVKDAWDDTSDEDEEEDTSEATDSKTGDKTKAEDDDREDEDDADESEETESEDEVEEEHRGEAEKRKQRALDRISKRKEENLKKLNPDNLRAPVVCVLGHVDHGKTKILDKLRRSNVQEGEVGGITQQIGATNVPAYAVKKQTHMVKDFNMDDLKFPGLLIIDTPGHESFRNLRSRGSSLCDIAILVVDITQGLEPQTRESISLLRKRATPFLVALNKVDRVYEWESHPSKDIRDVINLQAEASQNDFERRSSQIIQGFREEKLNSALFWENPNEKEYLSLVPTSAISGDGMGNLISLICSLCQNRLKKNLMFSEELQCTVLEVKTIQGHGTTIDVILVNGRLREGDTIILAGTEGPIVTQIRSLLLPKPLKEIRVKGQYDEVKEICTAQGVKIAARDLEKAIPGLSLKVAYHEDEVEVLKEEVDREFHSAMRSMKVKERGVYVQASTLGALEALLEFFKSNDVPYSGIRVGPVVKRDVMRAAAMLEHDPMYAVILAFDVKVEKDAQELADKEGVKIFSEETIYHLGDRYVEYLKDYKKKKQDEFRHIAVFPSKCRIIPTAIFNKRDPIVLGVTIEAGVLRTGTPLCVPSKEFVEIGVVTSMEFDHKNVDLVKKGDEVCIKIENTSGQTPKLFGRHFEAEDMLVSKISRESINACKDYFRDDLSKNDWKLMLELKKQFQIL